MHSQFAAIPDMCRPPHQRAERKAVAKAGRKRKTGQREANGRIQRKPVDLTAIVKSQPHRAWAGKQSDHAALATPCGRIIIAHRWGLDPNDDMSQQEFLTAHYRAMEIHRNYMAAISAPKGFGNMVTSGGELEPEEAEKRKKRYDNLMQAFEQYGYGVKFVAPWLWQDRDESERPALIDLPRIKAALWVAHEHFREGRNRLDKSPLPMVSLI